MPEKPMLALTFDDLPVCGDLIQGVSRYGIHRKLTEAFLRHRVPAVTGFLVGSSLDASSDHRDAVAVWMASGHIVANHTFSHVVPEILGAAAFIKDINQNEEILRRIGESFHGTADSKLFRYPQFSQGADEDSKAIRRHLEANNYLIAGASCTCSDWAWNNSYIQWIKAGLPKEAEKVEDAFIKHFLANLEWSCAISQSLVGRSIAQVVLLHVTILQAQVIDRLLYALRNLGVRLVSLKTALADPIYHQETPSDIRNGSNVLHTRALTTAQLFE